MKSMIFDVSKHQVIPTEYLTKTKFQYFSGAVPAILAKYGEFQPFLGFGAQKRSFGPKMGLRRPLRKSSDKHEVLGAFLEALRRKN